jgi:hypothetical protein
MVSVWGEEYIIVYLFTAGTQHGIPTSLRLSLKKTALSGFFTLS